MKESLFSARIEFWRGGRVILYFTSVRLEEKSMYIVSLKSNVAMRVDDKSWQYGLTYWEGLCPPCLWYIGMSLLQDFFLYTNSPPEPLELHHCNHCRGKCGINDCSPGGEINSKTSTILSPFLNALEEIKLIKMEEVQSRHDVSQREREDYCDHGLHV